MDQNDEAPHPLSKIFVLYAIRSAHEFCAARIRKKLADGTDASTLLAEAYETVRRDIGPFPSEETHGNDPYLEEGDPLERDMREIASRNFESLSETESYMWGLGIAGVFHQWERDSREAVATLGNPPPEVDQLNKMTFEPLCSEIEKTGFAIRQHASFQDLRTACLITNTIKHGDGPSFKLLVAEKLEMFQGGPVGVRMGNLPPEPRHLRIWHKHFDEVVAAIYKIWDAYEDAVIRKKTDDS